MTAQAGELLLQNGKRVWMQTLPLEAYWHANPPRPYMIAESSAGWRGYIGEWEISDRRLYLKQFEATAWTTSKDWVGNEGLRALWSFARLRSEQSQYDRRASLLRRKSVGIRLDIFMNALPRRRAVVPECG